MIGPPINSQRIRGLLALNLALRTERVLRTHYYTFSTRNRFHTVDFVDQGRTALSPRRPGVKIDQHPTPGVGVAFNRSAYSVTAPACPLLFQVHGLGMPLALLHRQMLLYSWLTLDN